MARSLRPIAGACPSPRPVALVLLVTCALLTACSGPPPASRPEVLPQVEVRFDRAVRKALDEVTGSRLLSVGLRRPSQPEPVWRTEVATQDGTVRVVRVDAVFGHLLGTTMPTDHSPGEKSRTAALVESAKVLPEEAAERVAAKAMEEPHFGKVTAVRLMKGSRGRTVWSVTVATVGHQPTHTYQVDAVTTKVVDSRTDRTAPPPPT
jgi:uncharacterized membrane protein YkoI